MKIMLLIALALIVFSACDAEENVDSTAVNTSVARLQNALEKPIKATSGSFTIEEGATCNPYSSYRYAEGCVLNDNA